jgi:hypothetical protein
MWAAIQPGPAEDHRDSDTGGDRNDRRPALQGAKPEPTMGPLAQSLALLLGSQGASAETVLLRE